MKSLSLLQPLAIVDIETTGASPSHDRIIEIAIIRFEEGKEIERFSTLVDPECSIPSGIFSLTGITTDHVKDAPTFYDISKDVERLLKGAIFIAHNVRFDYSFVKQELSRLNISFSARQLCTVRLSKYLYPEFQRHDLSTIISRFNFVCEDRHRALGDAQVLVDLLYLADTEHKEKFTEAAEKIIGRSRLPTFLNESVIKSLPEGPGVYIFYGEDGEKLYIGKSVNIRQRVVSHFGGMTKNTLRFLEEVRDIEARETAGELSALLLESHLIKTEQPLYNKLSRKMKKLCCVIEDSHNGYKSIRIEQYDQEELEHSHKIIGIFRSMMQAKKMLDAYAKEHSLCPRLSGLEKGTGACFYTQLGKCKGACASKEDTLAYNLRFDEAFSSRRLKAWPYNGPITITETKDKDTGITHIINEWRLVGSIQYDEGGQRQFLPQNHIFDYDAYKILVQHLKTYKQRVKIITPFEMKNLLTL
ncbi:MAG: exonuclease domain-containing protein [Patescibacteria group bacterium]